MVAFLILALQDPAVERVLAEYTKARPAEKELAIYALDWAPGLKEAKERKRPICLFVVTNSYGNLYTGHG